MVAGQTDEGQEARVDATTFQRALLEALGAIEGTREPIDGLGCSDLAGEAGASGLSHRRTDRSECPPRA